MNWGASCVISLHAEFNYSLFFFFSVFLCICVRVFYVCSVLSVIFRSSSSMGKVARNKTDDDDDDDDRQPCRAIPFLRNYILS